MAERLVRQFLIEVSLNLPPYDHRRDAPKPHQGEPPPSLSLLMGAVDNAAAGGTAFQRALFAALLSASNAWAGTRTAA